MEWNLIKELFRLSNIVLIKKYKYMYLPVALHISWQMLSVLNVYTLKFINKMFHHAYICWVSSFSWKHFIEKFWFPYIYISDVFHNSLTLLYYRVLITVCDHQWHYIHAMLTHLIWSSLTRDCQKFPKSSKMSDSCFPTNIFSNTSTAQQTE